MSLGEAFNVVIAGLLEMSKEQRYRWMDKLFWRRLALEIKVNRESRGWSQDELAKKCGTKQSVVSRWENPRKIKGISICRKHPRIVCHDEFRCPVCQIELEVPRGMFLRATKEFLARNPGIR